MGILETKRSLWSYLKTLQDEIESNTIKEVEKIEEIQQTTNKNIWSVLKTLRQEFEDKYADQQSKENEIELEIQGMKRHVNELQSANENLKRNIGENESILNSEMNELKHSFETRLEKQIRDWQSSLEELKSTILQQKAEIVRQNSEL